MKKCTICPNSCILDSKTICGRKNNLNDNIVETTAIAIDPVEKKPLYHFMPGHKTLSIGTLGCNLRCLNCQNHTIAQPSDSAYVKTEKCSPEFLVELALKNNLKSISWTYNEPSIYPEWIIKTAQKAQQHDIKTILVTNAYTSKETLKKLVQYVDAVNIDLKSMDEKFYNEVCGGQLKHVLNSIEYYYKKGVHTEITTLLIPEYNNDNKSVNDIIQHIKKLSDTIPVHFSAFYPQYKLGNLEATKDETIFNACQKALQNGLKYVYAGNTYPSKYDNTYCKKCDEKIITRNYYDSKNKSINGLCPKCNEDNNIIM